MEIRKCQLIIEEINMPIDEKVDVTLSKRAMKKIKGFADSFYNKTRYGLYAWVIAAAVASPVKATTTTLPEFAEPSWRGQPLSVYAMWNFADDPGSFAIPATHGSSVSGGDHNLYIDSPAITWPPKLQRGLNTRWEDGKIYNDGHLDGWFVINLPSFIDNEPKQDVRVQIWYGDAPESPVKVHETFGIDGVKIGYNWSLPYSGEFVRGNDDYDEAQETGKYWEEHRISVHNPDYDIINLQIPPGAYIDQIVIDTISNPEPLTIMFLALGSLALLRRNDRKYVDSKPIQK